MKIRTVPGPNVRSICRKPAFTEFLWMAGLIESAIRESLLSDLPVAFYAMMVYRITSGVLALIESGTTGR